MYSGATEYITVFHQIRKRGTFIFLQRDILLQKRAKMKKMCDM